MFKWIANIVDTVRITWTYPEYECECKRQWVANADRQYSTATLEKEINMRMEAPLRYVATTFDTPIRSLESEYKGVQLVVAEAKEKQDILDRDYRSELDSAYTDLDKTRADLEKCKSRLSSAYDDLNAAKRSLDAWYSASETRFFGSGGKKLKEHAWIGQDLSERDHYKSQKERASSEIGSLKSEKERLIQNLKNAKAVVSDIKEARQRMFDLKTEGFDKRLITGVISKGTSDLSRIDENITRLKNEREDYIRQSKAKLGVDEIEKKVKQLRQAKESLIKAFDNDANVLERKANHRTAWLTAHGRSDAH